MTDRIKHLLDLNIKIIEHQDQRYETAGDYWADKNKWEIRISRMKNPDYEFLLMIHELVELYLTQKRGIKEEDITKFDLEHLDSEDPGSIPGAPYHKEHMFSMEVEKLIIKELGLDWKDYMDSFDKLVYKK
jgi:hypothetical protein